MNLKGLFDLFKESVIGWLQSEAALHAAALAYYTIFSLAPLLILSIVIASSIFSQAAVEGRIVEAIENTVGPAAAIVIEDIIVNSGSVTSESLATGISILFLLYGASVMFVQLRVSLNAMWGVAPKSETVKQNVVALLKARLLSAAAVLLIGFFVLAAMVLNALWTAIPEPYVATIRANLENFTPFLRVLASPLLVMIIFAIIFKTMPKAKIRWRDVWLGAAVTAALFWLGSYLTGLYLSYTVWTSIYGAAGSLIALLLWIYYSTWMFLLGAKFTQVYANKYGLPIRPDDDAMFIAGPLVEDPE